VKYEFYNQGEQSFTYVTLCVLPESTRLFGISRQNGRIGPKKICNGVYCVYQAQNLGGVAKGFGHDS
jgi:hypothetical protein